MRAAVLVVLALSLAGCSTLRGLAGEAQRAGDEGVAIKATAGNEQTAEAREAQARAEEMPALPGGLAGDTANRSYTPQ